MLAYILNMHSYSNSYNIRAGLACLVTCTPRAGHDGEPTEFVSAPAARAQVERLGVDRSRPQIFYCQSGVRTTQLIFVLYLLGWDTAKLRNYDGSWLEWSYHPENPIVSDLGTILNEGQSR